ncbi:hypothetical protein [Thermoproteus tenax]|uniref:hypothetical protein n=1 Tax=Thermoproteus tenax TaxID=2271 RepID=UPI001432CBE5|nr:hypothetical protein [Thermoproteus tenax]
MEELLSKTAAAKLYGLLAVQIDAAVELGVLLPARVLQQIRETGPHVSEVRRRGAA